ncbi:orotate phosphoribosyltransferase [Bacillus sp. 1P06AnD]|uniref:orotate phosphoribosyltransferase n=1 Tax=Bacillus sp. 1P06AnD TaxID=3132208 RepID=UPI0039A2872E
MKEAIAEQLLKIKAVFLQPNDPFTWSSGMKSPIYCDNRLTLSYPELRKQIASGLADIIKKEFPDAELIAGTATAGIPHAAWVSDLLDLPMCYIRSRAKEHGKGNQIEGLASPGQKVVIIEDLISTGGSVITAAKALREAGCEILGVASIFTYELEKGKEMLQKANIINHSLSNYGTLVQVAGQNGYIKEAEVQKLTKWREQPHTTAWMEG